MQKKRLDGQRKLEDKKKFLAKQFDISSCMIVETNYNNIKTLSFVYFQSSLNECSKCYIDRIILESRLMRLKFLNILIPLILNLI